MVTSYPTAWDDADQIEGFDLHDKADLVGKPFRVFGVQFYTSKEGVRYARLSVETIDRGALQFQDSSSTGVAFQISEYLAEKGYGAAIDSGELVRVNLVAPRGLRMSEYDREVRGRTVKAQTYYLTAKGGLPPAREEKVKPARKTAAPSA